eukprot:2578809-Pleurochrysis_carterae.AAC.3
MPYFGFTDRLESTTRPCFTILAGVWAPPPSRATSRSSQLTIAQISSSFEPIKLQSAIINARNQLPTINVGCSTHECRRCLRRMPALRFGSHHPECMFGVILVQRGVETRVGLRYALRSEVRSYDERLGWAGQRHRYAQHLISSSKSQCGRTTKCDHRTCPMPDAALGVGSPRV